jgi:hypothetical protein
VKNDWADFHGEERWVAPLGLKDEGDDNLNCTKKRYNATDFYISYSMSGHLGMDKTQFV